ncbi:hypothetical protein [Persicobacter diffluens]|uniref:Uncharacterized protein n=1 Tax=Persicobacter diffluens TaxID=981 RepID=A0AAN4VXL2_9BACT|nr:hypothetical protein PEDI_07520 [Persicobacter diffluens]
MANRFCIFLVSFLQLAFLGKTQAQEIELDGFFLRDSVMIGEDLTYIVTAHYPMDLNILFPDSLYNFHPFEYNSREVYTTVTTEGISTDSIVYHISTFETDSLQQLSVPIYWVQEKDSVPVFTPMAEINFKPSLLTMPDSIALETAADYYPVIYPFNYPYWMAGTGILLFLAIITFGLFGGKIKRLFNIRKLERQHRQFLGNFDQHTSKREEEALSSLWKHYMEKVDNRPYPKLTTKEIGKILQQPEVLETLRLIDMNIYSQQAQQIDTQNYDRLRDLAISKYEDKLNQLKND